MGIAGPSKRGITTPHKSIFCERPVGLTHTLNRSVPFVPEIVPDLEASAKDSDLQQKGSLPGKVGPRRLCPLAWSCCEVVDHIGTILYIYIMYDVM